MKIDPQIIKKILNMVSKYQKLKRMKTRFLTVK